MQFSDTIVNNTYSEAVSRVYDDWDDTIEGGSKRYLIIGDREIC